MAQGEHSYENPIQVHEGPMADKRGTSWREDAVRLEALNAERIRSPWKTVPNTMTTMDKARAHRSKGDTGTYDDLDVTREGDHFRAR